VRDLSLTVNQVSKRRGKISVSNSVLNISVLASIGILGLVYLFTINSMGTKGYEIKKLESQMETLQEQQKNLMLQTSNLQSIDRIQEQATKLNFVPTNNVSYLRTADFALK